MPHRLPYAEYLNTKVRRHAERVIRQLYPDNPEKITSFVDAIVAGTAKMPALLWLDKPDPRAPFIYAKPLEWQPDWITVLDLSNTERPSYHPLYAEGAYYPLDFSSVATVSGLLAIPKADNPETIIDVCSAPGGKAIFAHRLRKPSKLICNELIVKRHRSLRGNLDRCKVTAEVTALDPARLAERFTQVADIVLVDAPCSGQSLIARGEEAAGAFQDHMISMNASRQRRILAQSLSCLKPGGYMLYTTCTYSRDENEKNVAWLLKQFPALQVLPIPHLEANLSNQFSEQFPSYRIEPTTGLGAGGFTVLFKLAATN
jgi:16S rRNA C967 or C1407 C5-methylase (RsmB/RsmF family)